MVEAPRIRILYDSLKFTTNKKIIDACGPSYKRIGINMIGYYIKEWWFVGKYIYLYLISKNKKPYVIRTHMIIYGKIIINDDKKYPNLTPFFILELDDGTTLTWYLSQITLLDPNCNNDMVKSNYTTCSSKKSITDSKRLQIYDISSEFYDNDKHIEHLLLGLDKYRNDIFVDFLLDQEYFPGIGNISQQEALYRCKILPMEKISNYNNRILKKFINCFVKELANVIGLLYRSYLDKLSDIPHNPVLQIYSKRYCPLGHKTITKYLGFRDRKTTWCPICQK